jgi:hypothetical protein
MQTTYGPKLTEPWLMLHRVQFEFKRNCQCSGGSPSGLLLADTTMISGKATSGAWPALYSTGAPSSMMAVAHINTYRFSLGSNLWGCQIGRGVDDMLNPLLAEQQYWPHMPAPPPRGAHMCSSLARRPAPWYVPQHLLLPVPPGFRKVDSISQ